MILTKKEWTLIRKEILRDEWSIKCEDKTSIVVRGAYSGQNIKFLDDGKIWLGFVPLFSNAGYLDKSQYQRMKRMVATLYHTELLKLMLTNDSIVARDIYNSKETYDTQTNT